MEMLSPRQEELLLKDNKKARPNCPTRVFSGAQDCIQLTTNHNKRKLEPKESHAGRKLECRRTQLKRSSMALALAIAKSTRQARVYGGVQHPARDEP
ncbi:jg4193 [Pararge aegeria aegeria]|uniref:Jg4193 protein n=1 Tax=Pararge aegeria aegeria TaxID=348720 RepID=A0A8S4QZP6_9NEOP|nr:jg4193 [Pararge aegeria aegeria]